RTPAAEEIEQEMKESAPTKPGEQKDAKDTPENAESGVALAEDDKKQASEDETKLRDLLAKIPRAKKIPVKVDQLPTGEYALREEQTGEAAQLGDGSDVVVIGLYQLAEGAKLKVLESL